MKKPDPIRPEPKPDPSPNQVPRVDGLRVFKIELGRVRVFVNIRLEIKSNNFLFENLVKAI